ncbi:MAG: ribbon-helix-helix domain-containing protein [Candidatus Bathyarchaeia archaeon]
MKMITLYLPDLYIKALDRLVDEKFYPNRAEAIRVAVRDLIKMELWSRSTYGRRGGQSVHSYVAASSSGGSFVRD